MIRTIAIAGVALALAGCATRSPPLYQWGNYEELIYASYAAPGNVPPEKQVEILEADYQKARADSRRMPPGWHAQLGFLYYQLGKGDQARQELMTEKAQFPESGVFVDRLLANLRKQ
jgi:hypothetical protein